MMMTYEDKFLFSLLVTSFVECVGVLMVWLFLRFVIKKRNLKILDLLGVVFFASALTLPYLWFILPRFLDMRFYIWYGEGIVVLAEMIVYWWFLRLKIWEAFLLSLFLNALSYFIGLVVL